MQWERALGLDTHARTSEDGKSAHIASQNRLQFAYAQLPIGRHVREFGVRLEREAKWTEYHEFRIGLVHRLAKRHVWNRTHLYVLEPRRFAGICQDPTPSFVKVECGGHSTQHDFPSWMTADERVSIHFTISFNDWIKLRVQGIDEEIMLYVHPDEKLTDYCLMVCGRGPTPITATIIDS